MTVTWEWSAGSTDVFAVRAAFTPDPHGGRSATTEESSSWGALQLWVAGHNLCAQVDQGKALQSTHWYLLPLLEWVVASWDPLLHEERLPDVDAGESAASAWRCGPPLSDELDGLAWEQASYDWWARHALRSARSGGLVPNVFICRVRDQVEVSWGDEQAVGTPPGFTYGAAEGRELLAPEAVAGPLYQVVKAAADHLAALPTAGDRIMNLGARLGELGDARQSRGAFRVARGRLSVVGANVGRVVPLPACSASLRG